MIMKIFKIFLHPYLEIINFKTRLQKAGGSATRLPPSRNPGRLHNFFPHLGITDMVP